MGDREVLVTIQLRFPALDRQALAEHIQPLFREATTAGGNMTSFSIQYINEEDQDE
jgi:hypothetical protein